MFKLVWFEASRKFIKACWQEPETIDKSNFVFEFLVIIINTRKTEVLNSLIINITAKANDRTDILQTFR